jgi:hypothetical protein
MHRKGGSAMNKHAIIILVFIGGIIFSGTDSQGVSAAPVNEQSRGMVSGITTPAGEAYASYHRAAVSGNIKGVKKLITKENHKKFDSGTGLKFLTFYQKSIPKNITIVKEDVQGNSAILVVKGRTIMGKGQSTINMRREDNAWKVVKDKWKFFRL